AVGGQAAHRRPAYNAPSLEMTAQSDSIPVQVTRRSPRRWWAFVQHLAVIIAVLAGCTVHSSGAAPDHVRVRRDLAPKAWLDVNASGSARSIRQAESAPPATDRHPSDDGTAVALGPIDTSCATTASHRAALHQSDERCAWRCARAPRAPPGSRD